MIYMIDSANIEDIKRAFDLYPLEGVTTNPTIVAKEKGDFKKIITQILSVVKPRNASLHIQSISENAEGIVEEAKAIRKYFNYDNIYIKIPVLPQGIKAMRLLSAEKFNITATAIITPQQAVMAAQAGAEFLAPYINRIEDIGGDSESMVAETVACLEVGGLHNAKILGASFKNVHQVHRTILAGAQSVTINKDTLDRLLFHPLSEWSVDQFGKDWQGQYKQEKITDWL